MRTILIRSFMMKSVLDLLMSLDAGVYKTDAAGREAFRRFIAAL